MAERLHSRNASLTVIVVGGVVNTIFLGTRQSTHDVDILGTNLNNDQLRMLDDAAHYAEQRSPVPLGAEWFNSDTKMWLGPDLHRELTNIAMEQDERVFQRPGLTLLAAPWNYAFCAKIARILTGEVRPYDLTDAATYLHRYIQRNGGRPVQVGQIEGWAQRFGRSTDRAYLIREVNAEYRRLYRHEGIVR